MFKMGSVVGYGVRFIMRYAFCVGIRRDCKKGAFCRKVDGEDGGGGV